MRTRSVFNRKRRACERLESRELLTAVPFSSPMTIDHPTLDEPSGVFGVDLDNDGIDELIVEATIMSTFREISGFHIYKQSAAGYELQRTFSDSGPAIADFNGDGFLDIAAIRDRQPQMYFNLGDGTFPHSRTLNISNSPRHLTYRRVSGGDFDADGDVDLAVHISSLPRDFRGIAISENDGSGNFAILTEDIYFDDRFPSYAVVDIDNDGDDDVVSYSRESRINQFTWHERVDGTFEQHMIATGAHFTMAKVRAEDTNDDGTPEIILQTDQNIWQTGDESTAVYAFDAASRSIALLEQPDVLRDAVNLLFSDFDGDNDIDVIRQDGNQLTTYLRQADGLTATSDALETKGDISDSAIVDLDQDGLPDIAATSKTFDTLVVGKNLGSSSFQTRVVSQGAVDNVSQLDSADLNDNGRLDLLVGGESLVWYPASPNVGEFESPILLHHEPTNAIQVADLDNDGDYDVVVASTSRLFGWKMRTMVSSSVISLRERKVLLLLTSTETTDQTYSMPRKRRGRSCCWKTKELDSWSVIACAFRTLNSQERSWTVGFRQDN